MLIYTGIGSQKTPPDICILMTDLAKQLSRHWFLRSGYADGADRAFGKGAHLVNGPQVHYLPWKGFNSAPKCNPIFVALDQLPSELVAQATDMAARLHPNWNACSQGARKMHTRNMFQVLGNDLNTPADMVVCWTPRGSGSGGTGQAMRLAKQLDIPIFDLAITGMLDSLLIFVEEKEDIERSCYV